MKSRVMFSSTTAAPTRRLVASSGVGQDAADASRYINELARLERGTD